jgi:PBP1b-binding outer membrane lipoprotein LpoB
MKIVSSLLILGALLYGCAGNPAPRENATTVVVPPSSGTTTVVVPHESRTVVLCRDGSRPPCY